MLFLQLYMYEVKFKDKDLYTEVFVSGERTSSQRIKGSKAWAEIAAYCNDHEVKKLLIISKLKGSISATSSYHISNSLEYFGLNKDIKISFVELGKQSLEMNSISSRYSRQRGYEIRVFDNVEDAVSWLIS